MFENYKASLIRKPEVARFLLPFNYKIYYNRAKTSVLTLRKSYLVVYS